MRLSACVAALICLSLSQVALAQQPETRPGPATPVEVTNTPSNPVPVTGTLAVTTATPLPIVAVNLDDTVLNAFQTRILFGSGNPQSDKEFLVPAGKRLVIQSITANADVVADQRPEVFLGLNLGGKFSVHSVPMALAGRDSTRDVFTGLHPTRWFADGGTKVTVVCRHVSFTANTCGLDMSISGFLVTMP